MLRIGSERRLTRCLEVVDAFVWQIVAERRSNLERYEDSGDLLSLFLSDAQQKGEELSDRYLRDVILNFMLAGRDTTASALTSMFHELSLHSDALRAVQLELDRELDPAVQLSAEVVRRLYTLEATFLESIRLHPPVPSDIKCCMRDCVLPSGEKLPAGTHVAYTPATLNQLPHFYDACATPALKEWAKDCTEFRPDRWIVPDAEEGRGKILNPPAHEFVVSVNGRQTGNQSSIAVLRVLASSSLCLLILSLSGVQRRPASVSGQADGDSGREDAGGCSAAALRAPRAGWIPGAAARGTGLRQQQRPARDGAPAAAQLIPMLLAPPHYAFWPTTRKAVS